MAVILVLATLMGKSPIYFLTGLGAMSAVLLILFRDTLLSMFANLTYILQHPKINHDGMTLLVRQLQPTENGLPIELYCFTTDTQWAPYESTQATIFDHLLSLIPVFVLRLFQAQTDFSEPDTTSRKVNLEPRSLLSFGSVQQNSHQEQ